MTSTLAEFDQVSKSYGRAKAVESLSFKVFAGEVLAFLGPNGAGKSTSLKLLQGLRQPSSGKIRVFGQSPHEKSVRQRVGSTPQDLDFPVNLRVSEILRMVCWTYGSSRAEALLERLQLTEIAEQKAGVLSGGEKRRLGLACALAGSPELLLLDEPTTGLDVESRRLLWDVIHEEQKRGATVLLTTHYLDEVEKLAHRVIVIDHGQKLFEGSVLQIKARVDFEKVQFDLPEVYELPVLDYLSIERKGRHCTLLVKSADEMVRELVRRQVPFQHLHVNAASLEEAFLQFRQAKKALPENHIVVEMAGTT